MRVVIPGGEVEKSVQVRYVLSSKVVVVPYRARIELDWRWLFKEAFEESKGCGRSYGRGRLMVWEGGERVTNDFGFYWCHIPI